MADEALISQHDEGSLWDELSHQHSREIQQHRYRISSTARTTPASAIRSTLQNAAAAVTSAASAAAAAAASAAERRNQQQQQQLQRRQYGHVATTEGGDPSASRVTAIGGGSGGGADAALAEFGLHPSSMHHSSARGDGDYRPPFDGGGGGGPAQQQPNAAAPRQQPQQQGAVDEAARGNLSSAGERRGADMNISLLSDGFQSTTRPQEIERESRSNFVFLDNFRLRPRREGWGAVPNLDIFFSSIYNYYYHRGLVPIIGNGIVEIISLLFTLWLSVFLFAYLDWKALATCTDETTCNANFHSYIIEKPFSRLSLWNFLIVLYIILFTCYGVFSVVTFLATVRDALEAKAFFEEKLGISARKLEGGAVEWDEIVQNIVGLQETGEYRVAIHGQDINALTVAQIITRKENFMVAFINRNMLDLKLPWPLDIGMCREMEFFSKSLEWSLYFCILSYMFNHKYKIRPAFYMEPASLKRRLTVCAVAHAVFMPFLLFFMMLHFSMRNLYDWKSSQKYLGPKEWSHVAKWTFREFNELPHAFERRIAPSYEAAEEYLKLFTKSAAIASLGRALVFISGSLGAVLIAFAAVNDSILLHVKIGQWNLLWYVGILGVAFSIGKAMLPDATVHPPYIRNLFAEMDSALAKVATHTHYYPDIWKGRGWDKPTQQAVSAMFQYKAKLFVAELVAVIFAPVILGLSLPKRATDICSFVQNVKVEVPGAGDVCGYSTFDFNTFEDESWEGRTMQSRNANESIYGSGLQPPATQGGPQPTVRISARPKTRHGKMEKSFFSFKAVHPSWKCSSSGQYLVDRVASYQHQQAVALARERNYHIEAAAKQLETLRLLEQRQHVRAAPRDARANSVDEAYIAQPTFVSEADAGAHSGVGGSMLLRKLQDPNVGHGGDAALTPPNVTQRVHFEGDEEERPGSKPGPSEPNVTAAIPQRNSSGVRSPSPANAPAASVLHYADAALSTELLRVLNRSTLDPNLSAAGSVLGTAFDHSLPSLSSLNAPPPSLDDDEALDRNAQRQYMWLERYHSHVAAQQDGNNERERRDENRTVSSVTNQHRSSNAEGTASSAAFDGDRSSHIV